MKRSLALITVLFFLLSNSYAQTWVDSMDVYAREMHLPAKKYKWTWVNAALLKVIVLEYDEATDPAKKQTYLNYVKDAMGNKWQRAHGSTPNAVASGLGLAFLYRITKEQKYLDKALEVYADYMKIDRCSNGGVSHLRLNRELWDDTVFMIGQFMLEMYRGTGEQKYLDELIFQINAHREKLRDTESGLWFHGWDNNDDLHFTFCSQRKWPNKETRVSAEVWGRGNGWVVVTLADLLQTMPKDHKDYSTIAGYLVEMIDGLPAIQDAKTGHWFQLPLRPDEGGNWIESSCTAMFSYGMMVAMKLGIVNDQKYTTATKLAYEGLRKYSVYKVSNGYLNTQNICKGTCIGNMDYYFKRGNQTGKSYGLGSFIQFGILYEQQQGIR